MSENKSMEKRLEQQLDFIREIDKVKDIFRQNYLCAGNRRENDAEHSWHMAVMTFMLAEYADEDVDILHVIKMALVHDLVEIDAGDTYAYDPKAALDKNDRELAAAERIFNILPKDQARMFRELWDEFETGATKDAAFAIAMDVLQPVLLNEASGGKSWMEHEITRAQVEKRISRIRPGSEILYQVASKVLDRAVSEGKILDC